ncbi:MAG TPA: Ig-like domain-containing protein [Geobacteraceae bacterium]
MNTSIQPTVTLSGPSDRTLSGAWQTDSQTWKGSYQFSGSTGDGAYTITVSGAKDLAGNIMNSQAVGSFVLDTVAPTVTIMAPASGLIASKTPQLSYNVSDGTVVVKVDGTVVNKTTGTNLAQLADGTHTVLVQATDAATNTGSAQVTFTVDTTAPTIGSTIPASNALTNSASAISVVLSDGAGVNLQASLAGAVVKNNAGTAVDGAWSVVGNAIVFTPTTQLADGTYTVTLYPADTLGNTGTASFGFAVDTTKPTANGLTLSPSSPVKAGAVNFTLTFSEAMTTSVQPVVTATRPGIILDTTYTLTGSWQNSTTWKGSYAFTADSGDATYTVKASGAKDVAGNTMAEQTVGTFILDTTPPATPVLNAVATPTRTATQTITGTKQADTAIVINGVVRVAVNSATSWSYNYPLAEGANALAITARDAAGNDSTPITPVPAITLDTTPPPFTVDTYKNPSPTVSQVISGTKEPGCVVKVNGTTIMDATDQNATWSYTLNLTDGITNHLVFTAADALGNTTTKTLDILCDTAPPPALAAGMLVADGSGKGTEVTLTWPSYIEPADLGYYRVYVATTDYTTVTGLIPIGTVTKGTRNFKATGLTQGTLYWFAVVPVSASGNTDTTIHTASAVPTDTVAPEDVTGLAAWAGYSASDGNTVTLSWTASANTMADLADQLLYMDAGQGYDVGTPIGNTAITFTKKGLADATLYKFKVTTKDTLGHESAGAIVTAVTRLANPTGVAATPGNQKAVLTWTAVASPYVKVYNIYRLQSASQQADVSTMTLIKSQTATNFTDTGLTNGASYQYAVTVLNIYGAERTSVQSITTTPRGDTTGPVLSGVNLTPNQVITAPITITASAQDSESAMGRMEIWIDGVLAMTQTGSTLSFAWNVVNTTDGNHTIKIDAYDSAGNLTEQSIAVVVSLAPPPTPVITSTFTAPINQKTTTITGTTQAGASVSLRVNGTVVSQTTAATTTFTFTSVPLAEGDNYVSVKAGNRGGDSPFSADTKISVVTTAPSAPVNFAAKALAGGSVQFTWAGGASGAAVGYNLYEVPAAFTALTDAGVRKTNTSLITYLLKEYIPADDSQKSYVVTAVDGAGNESPASNLVTIASDRAVPTATTVTFTDAAGATPGDNTFGPGSVNIALTVSEALTEIPFFSFEPQNASPIVVALRKVDDTHYAGSFTLDATSPSSPTIWKFSGKDVVGNRGSSQGTGPTIDVKGPVATVMAPVTLLKTTAGPVTATFTFDEASTTTPSLTLKASDGTTAQVSGLSSTDNGIHWSGTLDPGGLTEGTAQFIIAGAKDRFGNTGATVKSGSTIILYKDSPPAPIIPAQLTTKSAKAGAVILSWAGSPDAQKYNIYRRDTDSQSVVGTVLAPAVTFTDTPPADGTYYYNVSAVGLLESESGKSAETAGTSDRTPPAVPTGVSLTLTGNGVEAAWNSQASGTDTPNAYRLYRAAAPFTTISGLTPVITIKNSPAVDTAPSSSLRYYAVTALDVLGNESAPSTIEEIAFPVAPVKNLVLTLVDDGKPSVSWEAGEGNLQGFYIYRNGNKINQTPTTSTSYSDGYYSGGTVAYGVSAVNSLGNESPVKEVTLPSVTIALKDGTTMHRGVLETVPLMAMLPAEATANLTIDAVSVKIGTLPESTESGPFTVVAGTPLEIDKVAATEANAPSQEAVVVTAIMNPSPGTTVKIARSSLVAVLGSGTALEIFNEPLVRGTQASVRIKVNNLGSARTEFLTSENNGATSHVTVTLKDEDGNTLAQGHLNQRTGGAVVNSGSFATARLEPGESFLSDPITFAIPASAPYKVSLEAKIDNTYYHYNQADQVVAPGFTQAVDGSIADVSYLAQAKTDKSVYKQGEPVQITGQATSTASGAPMPLVPVKIGVSVKGFDRFFTVTTDATGAFSYTFVPAAGEAGGYSVWATHPDLADRTVQAQFSIIGLQVYPALVNVQMLKGKYQDIPVTLTNLGGSSLTALTLTASASSGITASILNAGTDTLSAGEKRTITFRVAAAANAPDTGAASLAIATAEGLSGRVDANVSMVAPVPIINTSPSYIDTGLMRGTQRIASFTLTNTGYGVLQNARIEGPSLPWLTLTMDKNLGDIAAGQAKSVGININPPNTVAQGIYNDRLIIYSDNHIPYTYNVQVTVTSNAVGSVQFSLLDELMKQVGGASITIQNQSVTELIYTLTTAADGTASLTDIPEGRYSYNITAAGHKPYGGSFVITPGVWTTVPVGLEVNLVNVEWSVTPTTIQDQYQITISQTFETNVPAPVLVTDPPSLTLPVMQPGQVFNGEFTVTNHGLIAVDNPQIKFPASFGDYDIEVLAGLMPQHIGAMEKITIPYRVTRRQTAAFLPGMLNADSYMASICSEVGGFGGGGCVTSTTIWVAGTAVICPNTPQQRTVDVQTPHIVVVPTDCPSGTATGTYIAPPPPQPIYIGGVCTNCLSGNTGGGIPGGSPTPIQTDNPCNCKPDGDCCGEGGVCNNQHCDPVPQADPHDCKKQICQNGRIITVNNDSESCAKDGNVCTDDYCKDGECIHPANNNDCDDGLYCTSPDGESPGGDKCRDGSCHADKINDKQLPPYVYNMGLNFGPYDLIIFDIPKVGFSAEGNINKKKVCCETEKKMTTESDGPMSGSLDLGDITLPIPVTKIAKMANKLCGRIGKWLKFMDMTCDVGAYVTFSRTATYEDMVHTDCCKNKTNWYGTEIITYNGAVGGKLSLKLKGKEYTADISGSGTNRTSAMELGEVRIAEDTLTNLELKAKVILFKKPFELSSGNLGPIGPIKQDDEYLPSRCE